MAELIQGIAAVLELIFHTLIFLVRHAFTLIAYGCFKAYRNAKEGQWGNNGYLKYLELGWSALCIGILVTFVIWLAIKAPSNKASKDAVDNRKTEIKIDIQNKTGISKVLKIEMKPGGVSNVLASEGMVDLAKRIKHSVKFVHSNTNTWPSTASTDSLIQ